MIRIPAALLLLALSTRAEWANFEGVTGRDVYSKASEGRVLEGQ